MPDLAVIPPESVPLADGYDATTCTVSGGVTSRRFQPDGYSLWAVESHLDADAEMTWAAEHGDEAVVVLAGALEVDGRRCESDSTIVVEADVPAVVRALEDSRVVHFGPASSEPPAGPNGPPDPEHHGVHVITPSDSVVLASGGPIRNRYFVDSTCPTCRITLLRAWASEPYRSSSHSHSEDELMFLVSGDMRVGTTIAGPGTVLAIGGNRRYGFQSESGFDFINFRRDVSLYTRNPKDEPSIETVTGMTSAGYVWIEE